MTRTRILIGILLLAGIICGYVFHRKPTKAESWCPQGQQAQVVGSGKDTQGVITVLYMCGRP